MRRPLTPRLCHAPASPMDFLCGGAHFRANLATTGEASMRLDLLLTVLASAVIGWNLGSWLIPAVWLVVLSARASLANLPPRGSIGRAPGTPKHRPRRPR